MKESTAYNHMKRLRMVLHDEYMRAEIFKPSMHQLLKGVREKVWDDPAMEKLPRHTKTYLQGIGDTLFLCFKKNHIEWVLPFNGVMYKKFEDLPEAGKKRFGARYDDPERLMGKFVYKDDNSKNWSEENETTTTEGSTDEN